MSEQHIQSDAPERDLSRAIWQRGVGAVIMRELTDGAFDELPDFTLENTQYIWDESLNKLRTYSHEGLTLLWSGAYQTSKFVMDHSFDMVYRTLSEVASRDVDAILRSGFNKFTYAGNPRAGITESKETMTYFPVTLARSICAHARTQDSSESDRFKPQTLDEIADLLESPDFTAMVDASMFTANGFWRGFSTGVNSLATAGFVNMPYEFINGEVTFSDSSSLLLKKQVKDNNHTGVNGNGYGNSTSGCPAQHLTPSEASITIHDGDSLRYMFDKTQEELFSVHEQSVTQTGLTYLVQGLKANSADFDGRMSSYGNAERYFKVHPENFLTHP